jgi:hypothetical protein
MPKPVARISSTRLSDPEISRLAREIARDIKPLAEILEVFRLDAADFDKVSETKFFQVRLAEEIQLWNASDPVAINKRIETKTATMVEDCLLEVFRLIHDPEQPMQAKIEALKWAARMAGLGEAKTGSAEGGGVKITINVGSQTIAFDKEPKLPSRVIDGSVVDLTPEVS